MVRMRIIYLNVQVFEEIYARWDLPQCSFRKHKLECCNSGEWDLLIANQNLQSLAAIKDENYLIIWCKKVMSSDIFMAASTILEAAGSFRRRLKVLIMERVVREAIKDPQNSPWKNIFDARKAAAIFSFLNFKLCNFWNPMAEHYFKLANFGLFEVRFNLAWHGL